MISMLKNLKAYKAQAEKEGFTFDPEWQAAVDEAIASVK